MSRLRLFNAIIVSMLIAALILVALALLTVKALDRRVIEAAAARNRHAEFLLAASVVSQGIERPEDLRNTQRMNTILSDIHQLRPGIRGLEIVELVSGSAEVVIRAGKSHPAKDLSESDIQALRANKVISHFEGATDERAWVFTVPIVLNDTIVGALRGRFSVSKYDQLIEAQEQVAKQVAIGSVIITALTMLLLIRVHVHRPIAQLLGTMEQVRSGNLSLKAPISGPLEIRHLAENFNQMMARLQKVMTEKEKLLDEIRALNENLESRVAKAVLELQKEKDKVADAQLAAQRNSNLAALGEVSAIMAHELGNPLNAMYGHVQLIKNMALPDECVRHLNAIKAQVTRMSEVIKHILRSTHSTKEASAVQLNDVITQVIVLLQAPDVTLVTDLSPQLPPIALNKTSLHGLILNLMTNSLQAMNNIGQLTLTTRMVDKPEIEGHLLVQSVSYLRPMVRLTIEDSGIGIPGSIIEKICEPFFTTRHEQGGTGLGLAICRRVIASAGGQLAVRSSPGKSTTFTVDFPVWGDQA